MGKAPLIFLLASSPVVPNGFCCVDAVGFSAYLNQLISISQPGCA